MEATQRWPSAAAGCYSRRTSYSFYMFRLISESLGLRLRSAYLAVHRCMRLHVWPIRPMGRMGPPAAPARLLAACRLDPWFAACSAACAIDQLAGRCWSHCGSHCAGRGGGGGPCSRGRAALRTAGTALLLSPITAAALRAPLLHNGRRSYQLRRQ
jgi:hypothetical protein